MKIQAITQYNFLNLKQTKQKNRQQNTAKTQNYAYNPIAYNDLTFTGRLFRTPEDFYSCVWNKTGMPETMKQYLNADYEDRQHMPPQQMLALVFDDINETKNLEQVKRIFPKEPLFKNLSDEPNRKARAGILAEIDLMKDEGHSLFKNGKDNLGHYILKKIYVEGKTLKEINEDFSKDKSVYYDGLSPIEYDTLSAYGIKFPNNAFWKSFTHNRSNFNYTYTPRKPIEKDLNKIASTKSPVHSSHTAPKQRGRFDGIKDWELDKLTDAMSKGNGSVSETKKQLKKSNIKDEAQLNFVAKYLGEINSIVLEKLHVSPEMREFFENQDNLTKSQKQKLDAYWADDDRRYWRSVIMKQTIKMFMDDYGVDGQNDDFKALLEYAHGIKPNRLAQMDEHNKIQDEYEDMFANLSEEDKKHLLDEILQEKQVADVQTEDKQVPLTFDDALEDAKAKFDVNEYRFETDQGSISIVGKMDEALDEILKNETYFMPSSFAKKYINFIKNNKDIDSSYILTKSLLQAGVNPPGDDRLMPLDKVNELDKKIQDEFAKFAPKNEIRAAQQSLSEILLSASMGIDSKIIIVDLPYYTGSDMINNPKIRSYILQNKSIINAKYDMYKKPLSTQEIRKISLKLFEMLRNYNVKKSPFQNYNTKVSEMINSIAQYLKESNSPKLKDNLIKYITEFGGSARFLLDKDASQEMKKAKMEQIILAFALETYAPMQLI